MSDDELLHHYKMEGEMAILGVLFDRYMSLVYGVCLKYLRHREESRDTVMQVFERLTETLKVHEITHFKSWLYITSRNHCLMKIRSEKGRIQEEISPHLMESDAGLHQENEPEMELNLVKLEKCIETLGDEQKRCVQLFYLQQLSYTEVSTQTGFTMNQVKSYIQNGKRNLKLCMDGNG